MWTLQTRAEHDRDDLRYPSDLTDDEWQLLAPLLPPPAKTGRHRFWPMREVMNAICYVLRGGIPWRMLPKHFPPHQTTYRGSCALLNLRRFTTNRRACCTIRFRNAICAARAAVCH